MQTKLFDHMILGFEYDAFEGIAAEVNIAQAGHADQQ
jgi:hypothetical protein